MTDIKEIAFDVLREMYEEAEPSLDFDHALENPEEYDDGWYENHVLSKKRQQEILKEHLDKHSLNKHEKTQITMTAILHYGPASSRDESTMHVVARLLEDE